MMGYGNTSKFGRWQKEFAAALQEKDPHRLALRIEAAEPEVLLRLDTIGERSAEGNALVEALTRLEALKRERLGFVGCVLG